LIKLPGVPETPGIESVPVGMKVVRSNAFRVTPDEPTPVKK
jgi:hypothetical protein